MIRFKNVHGDVFVDDRKKDDRFMAHDGIVLDPMGDYLVVTTQSSSAEVHAAGKSTRLGPFSYLRVGANRFLEGKHNLIWIARETQAFLARIWALAGGRH
jgi:hypothetical protein